MIFASPIALLWLIPWAALGLFLLFGKREFTSVPFIELWLGTGAASKAKRQLLLPPRAILAILIAALLTILAAAAPKVRTPSASPHLHVLVDNGVTLTPPGRLAQLLKDASPLLHNLFQSVPQVTLLQAVTEDTIQTDASKMAGLADQIRIYPVNTSTAIQSKIARLLQETDDPVVLLSDQRIAIQSPRLFQIAPKSRIDNVGFVDIALRPERRAQLMLKIRNDSPAKESSISIVKGLARLQHSIALPESGTVQDYFFDLPEAGYSVEATINVKDDLPADNVAHLLLTGSNSRLEVKGDVGEALQRMVDVYTSNRAPDPSSRVVIICDSLFQIPALTPAVAVASGASALTQLRSPLQLFADHPITRSVDWRSIDRATLAAFAPGDGWTPLVKSNELVLLAVREKPARQVWVGFRSSGFESTRDHVILWSNIFDFLGEGGARYTYQKLGISDAIFSRQPGIQQEVNGRNVAMNVLDVKLEMNLESLTRLPASTAVQSTTGWIAISPWLSIGALLFILLGAVWLGSK